MILTYYLCVYMCILSSTCGILRAILAFIPLKTIGSGQVVGIENICDL